MVTVQMSEYPSVVMPTTRTQLEVLMDFQNRVKAKSRWCERERHHDQKTFQIRGRFFRLCENCMQEASKSFKYNTGLDVTYRVIE